MPLKRAVLRKSLETIKIVPQLRAVFCSRLEIVPQLQEVLRKSSKTLKILADSKVHVFLGNKPAFFDLGGFLLEGIKLFY